MNNNYSYQFKDHSLYIRFSDINFKVQSASLRLLEEEGLEKRETLSFFAQRVAAFAKSIGSKECALQIHKPGSSWGYSLSNNKEIAIFSDEKEFSALPEPRQALLKKINKILIKAILPSSDHFIPFAQVARASSQASLFDIQLTDLATLIGHVFGDSFIKDKSINGSPLEGMNFSQLLSFILKFDQSEKLNALKATLRECQEIEMRLLDIQAKIKEDRTIFFKERQEFVKWLLEKFELMLPGESLLLPGGWDGNPSGHAMLYLIEVDEQRRYTFKVYNTGAGATNHPIHRVSPVKSKYGVYLMEKEIEKSVFCSFLKWCAYFEIRIATATPPNSRYVSFNEEDLYSRFLTSFSPTFGNLEKHFLREDHYKGLQKSGTCVFKSLTAFLQDAIGKKETKRIKRLLRSDLLEKAKRHIAKFNQNLPIQDFKEEQKKWFDTQQQLQKCGKELQDFFTQKFEMQGSYPNLQMQIQQKNNFQSTHLISVEKKIRLGFEVIEEEIPPAIIALIDKSESLREKKHSLQISIDQVNQVTDFVALLASSLKKFARSTLKDLENGSLTEEEAEKVLSGIQAVRQECARFPFHNHSTARRLATFDTKEVANFAIEGIEVAKEVASKKVVDKSSYLAPLDLRPNWEFCPQTLTQDLGCCVEYIKKSVESKNFHSAYYLIGRVVQALLPPDGQQAIIWRKIPSDEIVPCLQNLAALSDLLVRANFSASFIEDSPLVSQVYGLTKILAISHELYHRIHSDPQSPYRCDIDISYLVHDASSEYFRARSPYFTLMNTKLQEDLHSSLHYLRCQEGKMFRESFVQSAVDADKLTISERTLANGKSNPECALLAHYLTSGDEDPHRIEPDKKKALTQSFIEHSNLKDEEEEIPLYWLVAFAMTDLKGDFVPKEFAALKKIIYLYQALVQAPFSHNAYIEEEMSDSEEVTESKSEDQVEEKHFVIKRERTFGLKMQECKNLSDKAELTFDCFELGFCDLDYEIEDLYSYRHFNEQFAGVDEEIRALLCLIYSTEECEFLSQEAGFNQNNILTKKIDASLETPLDTQQAREVLQLASPDDRSLQISKTIAYFIQHTNKLKQRSYQFLCQNLLFEPGLLQNYFKEDFENAFASCQKFVCGGFNFFKEQENIDATLFFFRLGQAFEDYAGKKIFESPVELLDQLLQPSLSEIDKKMVYQHKILFYSTHLREEHFAPLLRSCILYSFCQGNPCVLEEEIKQQLNEAYHLLADYLHKKCQEDPNWLQTHLSPVIKELFPQCDCSQWSMEQFPLIATNDGEYTVNLLNGQLHLKGGRPLHNLPGDVQKIVKKQLEAKETPHSVFEKGPNIYTFSLEKDSHYQVTCQGDYYQGARIEKQINGKWYQSYSNYSLQPFAQGGLLWQGSQGVQDVIVATDKKSHRLILCSQANGAIKNVNLEDDKRLGLFATNMQQLYNDYKIFKEFDTNFIVWKNAENEVQVIDCLTYELSFVRQLCPKNKEMRLYSEQHLGYFVSPNQTVTEFIGSGSYLVLENEAEEKKVLMGHRIVETRSTQRMSGAIEFNSYDRKKHCFTFDLTADAEFKKYGTAESLYLGYLYLAKMQYEKAFEIVSTQLEKSAPYTKEEIELAKLSLSLNHQNGQASAIQLQLLFLLCQDVGKWKTYKGKYEKEIINCFSIYLSDFSNSFPLNIDMQKYLLSLPKNLPQNLAHYFDWLMESTNFSVERTVKCDQKQPDVYWHFSNDNFPITSLMDIIKQSCVASRHSFNNVNEFLYLYSLARQIAPSAEQALLKEFLHLQRPEESQLGFIKVLKGVLTKPFSFPPYEEINQMLRNNTLNTQIVRKCFTDLLKLAHAAIGPASQSSSVEVLVSPPFEMPVSVKMEPIKRKKIVPQPPLLESVQCFFKSEALFDTSYQQDVTHKIASLGIEQEDRAVRNEILNYVNEMEIYFKNKIKGSFLFDKNALPALLKALMPINRSVKEGLNNLKMHILQLANKQPSHKKEQIKRALLQYGEKPLDIAQLLPLYLKANRAEYALMNPYLLPDEIELLDSHLTCFLSLSTQFNQIERIYACINKLKQTSAEQELLKLSLDLMNELQAKRCYNAIEHPEYLVFEYCSNLFLRTKQVESLERLLKEDYLILQLLMGNGKSKVLLPLLAIKQADGHNLSMIMIPEELMQTVAQEMQTGESFGRAAHRLNWNNTEVENLIKIRSDLKAICANRDYLLVTDREIHLFTLQMRWTQIRIANNEAEEDDLVKLKLFKKILRFLKQKATVLMDEVDTLLDCRKEVHLSLGEPKFIHTSRHLMTKELYQILLTDPDISSLVHFEFMKENVSQPVEDVASIEGVAPMEIDDKKEEESLKIDDEKKKPLKRLFTPEHYQREIKPLLVDKLLEKWQANLFDEEEELSLQERLSQLVQKDRELIAAYLKGKSQEDFAKIVALPQALKDTLAFIKEQIATVLPLTLNKNYNEHYGFFKQTSSILAGPFGGANKPKIGSEFGSYRELINYTIQSYLKEGIPLKLIQKEMIRLQKAAIAEINTHQNIPLSQTVAYAQLREMAGEIHCNLLCYSLSDEVKIQEAINQHINLSLHFICAYILPTIALPIKRISSNSQTLVDVFARVRGFSGTPWNRGTYHPKLKVDLSQDRGRAADELIRQATIYQTVSSDPRQILQQAINEMKVFNALIDAGALFKDMHNKAVAQEVLKQEALRPHIDAVIYYEENDLMILERSKKQPVAYKAGVYPTSRCFTFYDQKHCTGADIAQDMRAKAALTINKNTTLRDLLQSAWRMRDLDKGQKISLFVPQEVASLVKSLDIMNVLLFTLVNQAKQVSQDNFAAIRHQMHNVVYQVCQDTVKGFALEALSEPLAQELINFSVSTVEDEPFEQYGAPSEMHDAMSVLTHYKDNHLKWVVSLCDKYKIKESVVQEISEQLDLIIANALTKNREKIAEKLPLNVDETSQAEVEQAVTVTVEVNQEQEVQTDFDTLFSKKRKPVNYVNWRAQLNNIYQKSFFAPSRLDTQKEGLFFHVAAFVFYHTKNKMEMSRQIICSRNFIYTVKENYGDLFSFFQKEAQVVLLIQSKKQPQKLKMVLLHAHEAEILKKSLAADKQSPLETEKEQNICLYHLDLGVIQEGSQKLQWGVIQEELKNLCVQVKCLVNGTTTYSKDEFNTLLNWLSAQKDIEGAEECFKSLVIKYKVNSQRNYKGSVLQKGFKKARLKRLKEAQNLPSIQKAGIRKSIKYKGKEEGKAIKKSKSLHIAEPASKAMAD
jgi:hypothetical protein